MAEDYDFFNGPPRVPEERSEAFSDEELDIISLNIQEQLSEVIRQQSEMVAEPLTQYVGSPGRRRFQLDISPQQNINRMFYDIETTTTPEPDNIIETRAHQGARGTTAIQTGTINIDTAEMFSGVWDLSGLYSERRAPTHQKKKAYYQDLLNRKMESNTMNGSHLLNGTFHSVQLFSTDGFEENSSFHSFFPSSLEELISRSRMKRDVLKDVLKTHIPDIFSILSNPGMLRALHYKFNSSYYVYKHQIDAQIFNCCPMCGEKMNHVPKTSFTSSSATYEHHPWNEKRPSYFKGETVHDKMKRLTANREVSIESQCLNLECLFHSIHYKKGFHMSQLNQLGLYQDYLSLFAMRHVFFSRNYSQHHSQPFGGFDNPKVEDHNTKNTLLEGVPFLRVEMDNLLPKDIIIPRSIM